MQRHLHAIRQKPEHVRKSIAIGTAVGVTSIVALVWVVTLASTGAFALAPLGAVGSLADSGNGNTNDSASLQDQSSSNFSKLLGAVGATSLTGSTSTSPALTIVDQGSSSSFGSENQQPAATKDTPHTLSF